MAEGAGGGKGVTAEDSRHHTFSAFKRIPDDDDSRSVSELSEASTRFGDDDDSRSAATTLPDAFSGGSANHQQRKQKAIDFYNKELNDKIIYRADDATLFALTMKKHQAREEGSPGLLLTCRPAEVYGHNFSSWPPKKPILTSAAEFGRTKIIETLINEFKCDINVKRAEDSNTALHLACYYGHAETVDALLKMGADCLSPNEYRETPLQSVESGAQHWSSGQKKHKVSDRDPFFVCFKKTGRKPEHAKCKALMLAHIQHLEKQKQDPKLSTKVLDKHSLMDHLEREKQVVGSSLSLDAPADENDKRIAKVMHVRPPKGSTEMGASKDGSGCDEDQDKQLMWAHQEPLKPLKESMEEEASALTGLIPAVGGRMDMRGAGRGGSSRGVLQAPLLTGHVKPLERTENAYDINKTKPKTHYDNVMKEVRGILNKLTLTNFEKLSDDIVRIDINDPEELKGIVSIIFDKSLDEPHFCGMYARLCNKIKETLPKFAEPDTPETDPPPGQEKPQKKEITFKRCLLNKCQEEFERADRYEDIRVEGESKEQHEAKSRKVRLRMLGNIKFIGELYAQKILNEKIMHECLQRLLASNDEDTIECLCKLMATIGKLLDHPKAKHYMDYYFGQMAQTAEVVAAQPQGNRLKFMLKDTVELRRNHWVPRRETTGPKTIEEIRREAAKEGIFAGPIPPPRGGPMSDPRQRPGGDRGIPMAGGSRMGPPGGPLVGAYGGRGGMPDMRPSGGMGGPPGRPGGGPGAPGGMYGSGDYRGDRMGAGRPGVLDTPSASKAPDAPVAAPVKPKLTEDQVKKRIKSTLEEYLELKDVQEVKTTLEELDSREFDHHVLAVAVEMCWDKPAHADDLLPLMEQLSKDKGIAQDEWDKGFDYVLEFVEDTAVDVPSAPKVSAAFVVSGLCNKYMTWAQLLSVADRFMKETEYAPRFLALVLKELVDRQDVANAHECWAEGGLSLAQFGVQDEEKWIEVNQLEMLFPLPHCERVVSEMMQAGSNDDEIIEKIKELVPDPKFNRDVGQCLMRCVMKCVVQDMGGRDMLEEVGKQNEDNLIVPVERQALEKHSTLLKQFLEKECDQAYALFSLQRFAQDLQFPTGFLDRMLATLYDLQSVEEASIMDWSKPPDNRHPFLLDAKNRFHRDSLPDASAMHSSETFYGAQAKGLSPPTEVTNALSEKSVMFLGDHKICDEGGAVRIRIPSGGTSAILAEGLQWHKGLDLSASITGLNTQMQQQARRKVNKLLDGTPSSIIISGDAVHFEPSGTRFEPHKVQIVLPVDQGLLQGLRELEVPFALGVFKWNEVDGCWDERQRFEAQDATEAEICAEVDSFSYYVAALVIGVGILGRELAASLLAKPEKIVAYFAAVGPVHAPSLNQTAGLEVIIYSKEGRKDAAQKKLKLVKEGKTTYVDENDFILARRNDAYEITLAVGADSQKYFKIRPEPCSFYWTDNEVAKQVSFGFTSKREISDINSYFKAAATITDVEKEISFGKELKPPATSMSSPRSGYYVDQQVIPGCIASSQASSLSQSGSSLSSIVSSNQERYDYQGKFVVFPCKVGNNADVLKEVKKIDEIFQTQRYQMYQIDTKLYPSKEDMKRCIDRCATENLVGLHFAGHTNEDGEVVLEGKISKRKREPLPEAFSCFISQIEFGSTKTLRFVFVNACKSVELGRKLVECGIAYVLCWLDDVFDNKAYKFCKGFYETLVNNPGEYGGSFVMAASILTSQLGPCLLWKDRDEDALDENWVKKRKQKEGACVWMDGGLKVFSSVEEMMQVMARAPGKSPVSVEEESSESDDDEVEEGGEKRSLNNDKGKAEMEGFKALGFDLKFKDQAIGEGLEQFKQCKEGILQTPPDLAAYGLEYLKGRKGKLIVMSKAAVEHIFQKQGITYTSPDLWGKEGILVKKAQAIQDERSRQKAVCEAIGHFKKSLDQRDRDSKRKSNSGHDHMRDMIQGCVEALQDILPPGAAALANNVQALSLN